MDGFKNKKKIGRLHKIGSSQLPRQLVTICSILVAGWSLIEEIFTIITYVLHTMFRTSVLHSPLGEPPLPVFPCGHAISIVSLVAMALSRMKNGR